MAKKKVCPNCNQSAGIRKILYGMLMEEPDPKKYVSRGCCIEPAEHTCVACGWDGAFNSDGTERNLDPWAI